MTDFGSRWEALRSSLGPEASARAEVVPLADVHTPTAEHDKQVQAEKLKEMLANVDPSEVGDVWMIMLLGGLIAGVIGGVGGGLIGGLTNDRRLDNDLDHVFRRMAGLKTADKAFLTEETEMLKAGEISQAEFMSHIQERDGGEFIFGLSAIGFTVFASIVGISGVGAGVGGFFASRAAGDAVKEDRRLQSELSLEQIMEMAENGEDVGEFIDPMSLALYAIMGVGALIVGAGGAAVGTAVAAGTGAAVEAGKNGRRLEGELAAPMVDGDVDYPY